MLRTRIGAPDGFRLSAFTLAAIVALIAASADPADARPRRRAPAESSGPGYAAIVIDANSGAVMHASSADALRHPASLTKIMTLFLLFERLESGKLKLDSNLQVSEHASDQSPTKLGLKAGSTIQVEDAIKGMVTRSANDAAAVVAENLGGSETEFARMMTRKAQALGMSKTVYKNASGLPDSDQVTTARDQAILGRAIQERFPHYYKYFSTKSFTFRGQWIGNHNRLLGRVEGVDGIKTGYTRASGFNLVTSLRRNNRHIVAVVLGGTSASGRDARMRQLIDGNIATASVKRTAPMIADNAPKSEPRAAQQADAKAAQGFALASNSSAPVRLDPPATAAIAVPRAPSGSAEPIRPVRVKTVVVRPGNVQTASIAPVQMPAVAAAEPPAETPPATVQAEPPATRPVARAGMLGVLTVRSTPAVAPVVTASASTATAPAAPPKVRTGWMIQVGAFTNPDEAKQQLTTAKSKAAKLLAAADPFTEPTTKAGTVYHRARFAGLKQDQAEAACKLLKRNDVECITVKN